MNERLYKIFKSNRQESGHLSQCLLVNSVKWNAHVGKSFQNSIKF